MLTKAIHVAQTASFPRPFISTHFIKKITLLIKGFLANAFHVKADLRTKSLYFAKGPLPRTFPFKANPF